MGPLQYRYGAPNEVDAHLDVVARDALYGEAKEGETCNSEKDKKGTK